MNRQEALTRLRLRSHQAFCEYVENGNQENEEAALDVLAYDMAIAALNEVGSPTTQLGENGLVPCGCGERVSISFYPGWAGTPDLYQVDCFSCHVGTRPCQTAEQAKAAWNTAMGWKVGAKLKARATERVDVADKREAGHD